MKDDGSYTDDEWATIYGTGGAQVVPSFASTHYKRPAFRPYPSAAYAWLLGFLALVLFFPAFIAVPIAVRAGLRGNRNAWLAAIWAIAAAVFAWFVLPRVLRT